MRKGEMLADGEVMSFSPMAMLFMDASTGDDSPAIRVVDGTGAAAGHRPGFCYDGTRADLRDAATKAYEERSARLSRRDAPVPSSRQPTRDELEAAAAAAYEARNGAGLGDSDNLDAQTRGSRKVVISNANLSSGALRAQKEMKKRRDELEAIGHTVTARWVDNQHADDTAVTHAKEDIEDIESADVFLAFTEPERKYVAYAARGGRHVELGVALALDKRVLVVGYRENVFVWLPKIEFFKDWPDALKALGKRTRSKARKVSEQEATL
jgi:hypothetical protein